MLILVRFFLVYYSGSTTKPLADLSSEFRRLIGSSHIFRIRTIKSDLTVYLLLIGKRVIVRGGSHQHECVQLHFPQSSSDIVVMRSCLVSSPKALLWHMPIDARKNAISALCVGMFLIIVVVIACVC